MSPEEVDSITDRFRRRATHPFFGGNREEGYGQGFHPGVEPARGGGSARFLGTRTRPERKLGGRGWRQQGTGTTQRTHPAQPGLTFSKVVHRELERGQRDPSQHWHILFMDLDGFKAINDSADHAAGDAFLIETAAHLLRCLRATDTAARIGGDEFTVLLVGLRDLDEPRQIAGRIAAALAEPFRVGDERIRPRASVGVAVAGPDLCDPDELLRRADADMYRGKRSTAS